MSTPRPYRSTHRTRQAQETRLAIRKAARSLFGASGFTGTTVDAIARHAGVSTPTVYAAYGSKAAILAAIIEQLEAESGTQRQVEAMLAERDPRRQLELFVATHVELLANGLDVLRSALDARGEPEVRAMLERGDAHRRAGCDALVDGWQRAGAVGQEIGSDAAQRMWLLTTVESYVLASDLGWSPQRIRSWLTGLLDREILGTDAG